MWLDADHRAHGRHGRKCTGNLPLLVIHGYVNVLTDFLCSQEMGLFYDDCLEALYPPGSCGTFCNEHVSSQFWSLLVLSTTVAVLI